MRLKKVNHTSQKKNKNQFLRLCPILSLEEPGFRRMPIIRARATTKNAELNAELLN